MSIKQLNPYLFFDGQAAKAIAFYEKALGASAGNVMRYRDIPGTDAKSPHVDRIIHCELRLGGGAVMISDRMPDMPGTAGDNVQVCLQFEDASTMARSFDALSPGGRVILAPHDAFWGDRFGALVDQFGISWMFTAPIQK